MVIKRSDSRKSAKGSVPSASTEVVVAAGDFKARCLKILDQIDDTRRGIVVTKYGRPVARVVPIEQEGVVAALKGSVTYEDDLISPVGDPWSAVS